MKLRHLFLATAATFTLSLATAFSANAVLIKHSFDLEFQGYSATLELGANTDNATVDAFDDFFSWEGAEFEFINIINLTGNGVVEPNAMLTSADFDIGGGFDETILSFTASAFTGSQTGDSFENGFSFFSIEFNLNSFSDLEGVAVLEMTNSITSALDNQQEFEVNLEITDSGMVVNEVSGEGAITLGAVEVGVVAVNAPTTALFVALSIGGLLLSRRK